MYREGHIGAALLLYAPLAFVLAFLGASELAILAGLATAAVALIPDYDMRVPLVKHRGYSHSVLFVIVVAGFGAVGGLVVGISDGPSVGIAYMVVGFLVGSLGVGSHIAADALTPMGVTPYAPFNRQTYSYDVTRAANPISNYLLLGIGILVSLLSLIAGSAANDLVQSFP